ncbi:RNA polymerase sigma factor [Cesiribacter sp. SM1]|uniref:RNA polymerase sigma factor n=1 Tax=Cesiribacter sp. SM1 TaxID=2861196 RepID=UPI001CD5227A|nr:sigma-70 family RNA polymerase sigma factor [Cesiribacter sp. SM1]
MEATVIHIERPGAASREAIFLELYERAFPLTAGFVSKMGGTLEDAKDIFQDALVIYYEKSLEPLFITRISAEAYLLGIAKHLWIRKFKQHANKVPLTAAENQISIPDDFYANVDDQKLLHLLEKSGKKCLDILKVFYFDNLSMKKIAKVLGYASDRSATVQKFKCLEKVRDTIRDKSLGYEDFLT